MKKKKNLFCMKRNFLIYPIWENWMKVSGLMAAWLWEKPWRQGGRSLCFCFADLSLSLASPVQAARPAAAREGAEEAGLPWREKWGPWTPSCRAAGIRLVSHSWAGEECTWCPGENNVKGLLLASHLEDVKMVTEAVSGFVMEITFSFFPFILFPVIIFSFFPFSLFSFSFSFFSFPFLSHPLLQPTVPIEKSFRQQDPEPAQIPACCPQASSSQGNGQCIKELLCVTQGDQIKPSAWIVVRGCWCIVSFLQWEIGWEGSHELIRSLWAWSSFHWSQ